MNYFKKNNSFFVVLFIITVFSLLFKETEKIGTFFMLCFTILYFVFFMFSIYKKKILFFRPGIIRSLFDFLSYFLISLIAFEFNIFAKIYYLILISLLFLSTFFKENKI